MNFIWRIQLVLSRPISWTSTFKIAVFIRTSTGNKNNAQNQILRSKVKAIQLPERLIRKKKITLLDRQ